jgi:hypothetical protein
MGEPLHRQHVAPTAVLEPPAREPAQDADSAAATSFSTSGTLPAVAPLEPRTSAPSASDRAYGPEASNEAPLHDRLREAQQRGASIDELAALMQEHQHASATAAGLPAVRQRAQLEWTLADSTRAMLWDIRRGDANTPAGMALDFITGRARQLDAAIARISSAQETIGNLLWPTCRPGEPEAPTLGPAAELAQLEAARAELRAASAAGLELFAARDQTFDSAISIATFVRDGSQAVVHLFAPLAGAGAPALTAAMDGMLSWAAGNSASRIALDTLLGGAGGAATSVGGAIAINASTAAAEAVLDVLDRERELGRPLTSRERSELAAEHAMYAVTGVLAGASRLPGVARTSGGAIAEFILEGVDLAVGMAFTHTRER